MRTTIIALVLLAASVVHADEALVPAVTPTPANVLVSWRVTRLVIAMQPNRPAFSVEFTALASDGTCLRPYGSCLTVNCALTDAEAMTAASTLNIANLTNNSLTKRLIAWGQNQKCLPAGSVTGSPGMSYVAPTPILAAPAEAVQ